MPYIGGPRVDAPDRPLRLAGEVEPGWWRFDVEGRNATAVEAAEPVDLSDRPAVRGHAAGGYLFSSGAEVERFALPADPEPELLAPCTARRWHGGALLFDCAEFEDEAEERVRRALDDGSGIDAIKGAAPSLRAAFAYALLAKAAAEREIWVLPRESTAHVAAICADGPAATRPILDGMAARRREARLRIATERARPVTNKRRRIVHRLEDVLEGSGSRLLRWRQRGEHQLEVTFAFMGEHFTCLVASKTLRVIDAGICLSGADSRLTLDSLPSTIKEAIETHQLVVTWR